MNPLRTLVALFALLLACAGMPALAQDYPPVPKGPVYDGADMLSDATEAALDAKLRAYTAQTGRAIVVATVPTIGDQTIDQYGFGLFNAWGIGGKERDMGLLLVIARQERKMRIEVGYGLHPWFGGIMAGRVINDVITPRFKAGDFDTGVTEGVDAILAHLAKSPQDAKAIEEAAARRPARTGGAKAAFRSARSSGSPSSCSSSSCRRSGAVRGAAIAAAGSATRSATSCCGKPARRLRAACPTTTTAAGAAAEAALAAAAGSAASAAARRAAAARAEAGRWRAISARRDARQSPLP